MSRLISSCPLITDTVAAAVPIRGMAKTITSMYATPKNAPVNCQRGASKSDIACFGSRKKANRKLIKAPTAKVSHELSSTPTREPRPPLMADCAQRTAPLKTTTQSMRTSIGDTLVNEPEGSEDG